MMTFSTKRLLGGGLLVVWMGIIFAFSHQPGSGSNAEPPLWYILERKSAHIFEYAVLLLLSAFFFRQLFIQEKIGRILLIAYLFAITYGFLDEVHQSFIFGRGAKFSDALIDGGGALLMVTVLLLWRPGWLERKTL